MISNLKIGILFTAYNCDPYLERCFAPWFNLKNKINLKFAINSGMFSEYKKLGFTNKNTKTLEIIKKYKFDYFISTENSDLLEEDESRNNCLNYLKDIEKCDLIWFVDGDEIYKENEILNTIEFIENTPEIDCYTIMLRNFIFDEKYHSDFERVNIYRTDRGNGLDRIYFDSHLLYKDGTNTFAKRSFRIHKKLLFVDHYTWLTNDSRTLEKIEYQKIRYDGKNIDSICSYVFYNNDLFFNKKYYDERNFNYSVLHEFSNISDTRFTIDYNYKEKKLYISSNDTIDSLNIKLFDCNTNNLILDWSFDISCISRYWHICELNGIYKLEISNNERIIHMENFYVNYKLLDIDSI